MKRQALKKLLRTVLASCLLAGLLHGAAAGQENENIDLPSGQQTENSDLPAGQEKIKIKALILPKFEIQEMAGDYPGEAQFYYERYLEGGEEYDISDAVGVKKLYVKDGIALFVLGMGKVNAALSTMEVLSDSRFDFSDACIISTGCAGSSVGTSVMGDVFVITAAVDYDLGHHADIREMEAGAEEQPATWFHDEDYDEIAVFRLNQDLTERAYSLVKDVPLETTEPAREYMGATFDGEEWAVRDPKVLKGTTVTGDNYWKGRYDHEKALLMTRTYGCPDPYATTEMEDAAVALAVKRMGLLDHLLIIRDSVNLDVFMLGETPESLWGPEIQASSEAEVHVNSADLFETAMKNNFVVGSKIIDALVRGDLEI